MVKSVSSLLARLVAVVAVVALSASVVGADAVAATPTATSIAYIGPCTRASYAVPNGGFASGKLAPWRYIQHQNVTASVIKARDGPDGFAARLTAHGQSADGFISPMVGPHAICAATRYALYYEYRAIGNVSGCSGVIAFSDIGGGSAMSEPIYFTNASADQPFHRATLIFDNGYSTTYYLYVNVFCHDTPPPHDPVSLDVDSFELAAIGSLEPVGCPDSRVNVPNGDFESGTLSPWTVDVSGNGTDAGVVYNPNNPRGGKYNFRVDFNNPDADPTVIDGYTLTVGVLRACEAYVYVLSFAYEWVQESGPIPTEGEHGFVVEIHNGQGTRIFPTTGWQTANFTFTAGASGTIALVSYFDFAPYNPTTNKTTHFPSFALQLDDFKVQLATRK